MHAPRFSGFLLLCLFLVCAPNALASGATQLSFKEALEAILSRSTAISIQEAEVRETEYNNLTTRTSLLPSVTYSYSELTNKQDAGTRTNSQRSGLDASWNLFRFGADAASWKSAIYEERSEEHTLSSVRLDIELEAIRALTNFIGQSAQVEVAKKIFELNTNSHKIARQRFKKGLLPKQEVDKVFIDVENARARWQDARIRLENARADLVVLLGHDRLHSSWPWQTR